MLKVSLKVSLILSYFVPAESHDIALEVLVPTGTINLFNLFLTTKFFCWCQPHFTTYLKIVFKKDKIIQTYWIESNAKIH